MSEGRGLCGVTSEQLDYIGVAVVAIAAGMDCAGLSGPGGEVDDVVVGQVGGLDAAGDAVFGAQPGDPARLGVDFLGGVALGRPAVPQDGVRGSLGGAAERPPVAEQVAQRGGDDVGRWAAGWPRRR